MKKGRTRRQCGALERRERDVGRYVAVLQRDLDPEVRAEIDGKLQAAERDVANLKRKLGLA